MFWKLYRMPQNTKITEQFHLIFMKCWWQTECISRPNSYLKLKLYICEHIDIIKIISNKQNENLEIYKQMVEMNTGASIELVASEGTDYVIPFIGELKELIDENEEGFNQAKDVKQILLQYLAVIEMTASYLFFILNG